MKNDERLFKINTALLRVLIWIGSLIVILCAAQTDGQLIVKETEAAELQCDAAVASISQNVRLLWRKDGKVLRQVELGNNNKNNNNSSNNSNNNSNFLREDGRIVLSKQNGSLIFASIIAGDAGAYSCEQQTNDDDEAVKLTQIDLQVVELLKFVPQPTSKNLELGTLGKVHCKAQGTPAPQVKWLWNNNAALPPQVKDTNGTLVFRNVSTEQRGNYTCIATNSQGAINATVYINAVIAPRFSVAPPSTAIETTEQSNVYINCQAIGDPKPTIQWDKDLEFLTENNTDAERFNFHENGTLEIRNVRAEDEGRYGCTIGSSAGFKRQDVLLIVQSKSNSLVLRIIIIIICLAFLYFVLILSLKLCCRNRRLLGGKIVNLNEAAEHGGGAGGDGTADAVENAAENEPWLTEANSSRNVSISKSKKLRESTIIEQESQTADDMV